MGIEERYRLKKREVFLSRCISICILLSYFSLSIWEQFIYHVFYFQQRNPGPTIQGWNSGAWFLQEMLIFFAWILIVPVKWDRRSAPVTFDDWKRSRGKSTFFLLFGVTGVIVFFVPMRGIVEETVERYYTISLLVGIGILIVLWRLVIYLLFYCKLNPAMEPPRARKISDVIIVVLILSAKFALSWFLSEHLATQIPNFIYH